MFYCDQCKGCAYNTDKYEDGCECFTELQLGCRNYATKEDKQHREKQMEYHKQKLHQEPKLIYKHISGGSGKWVLTRV